MNTEFPVGLIIDFSTRMAHILGSRRVTRLLVSRPLFLFFPGAVIIHSCSEASEQSLSVRASRTQVASRQQEMPWKQMKWGCCPWLCRLCPAPGHLPMHPRNPGPALFAKSCALFFLIGTESLSTCQGLCLLNSIYQRRCPSSKINFTGWSGPARAEAVGPCALKPWGPLHCSFHTVILVVS